MNCPACKEPLAAIEYDALEVDYCVACRGVWLDAGELELLLGGPAVQRLLTAGDDLPRTERPRRCPICHGKMAKHTANGPNPVIYDQCTHGMWFDRGELDTVLQYGSASPEGEHVVAWLRELFAGKQPSS